MSKPIFQDETGKRWRLVKISFTTVLFTMLLFIYFFDFTLVLLSTILKIYLLVAIIIGLIRMAILMYFSYKQYKQKEYKRTKKPLKKKRIKRRRKKKFRPKVSVIIPVYNEEVVIERTVRAIKKSKYRISEILVVDDGSTDQTVQVVKNAFKGSRKVKVIEKENGGKASALNIGFQKAVGDIVITIDADTIFTERAITYLVRPFKDRNVAAVSGNCKIGNLSNYLAVWQHIEYVTAFNLEKRAYEYLNCITVVPGSNSAWRKKAVVKAGYYDHDTLAEDTDLTLKLLNNDYKIIYEDRALSYEECPEKIKDFIKQRYRWSYGILQSSWKHKKTIFHSKNRTLKYFAIPSMLFSYFLYLTAPLIDVIFIIALLTGAKSIFLFALFFYLTDTVASIYAFKLEKEKMKPLLWVFIQRLAYRYLIAYVTWKSILMALKGYSVGWNKFERSGTNQFGQSDEKGE
ncbi:glycosyltransferase family 2 protein [Bacillus luteolus]|uniref:Glycosyltransferase family 2 protein n=1 Tax=Litchfieldia luteola TaxID=682179 RepID=A0ABR9QFX4_9BACI|nr:glycosyltransferase [Cytobacillus luteolus]MBE4907139.1 glycosyltransferase family 2 protein [Cytobacillus luteolus]MBP1943391.1 cellulose synthase/poly-beta-1,6-N-acetylglucosamine synthase-like glycosyltransferase [Cytobacillus luteolus]